MKLRLGFILSLPNGQEVKFYAVLCKISGDNLSCHALGGFGQSFNSGRVCRFCIINYPDAASKFNENDNIL